MFVSFLLSRFGRKSLLQIGTLVTIIALIMITTGFFLNNEDGNITVVVGLFIWMIFVGMSINPIIWLYIAEISEPSFLTFPTMTNWMFGVLVSILFPILEASITAGPVFAFFTVYSFIFLLINQKIVVETKDKT